MYAVVGCSDCQALWIIEGRSQTTQCPRCGTTRQYEKRRKFVETEQEDHAREVRASMLANRQDMGEAFAEVDSFAELESRVEESVVDDEEYLEASGIDSEAVAEAGERIERGSGAGSQSRKDTVLAALRALDRPTEEDVVAYAAERDVPESYVRKALEKLVRAGEVSESGGTYRLL